MFFSISLADRHNGVGGDGVILICPSDVADAQMRMFNRDGSEGLMCGNGIRGVAKYLCDNGIVKKPVINIETKSGIKSCSIMTMNGKAYKITVDMGAAALRPEQVPVKLDGDMVVNKPVIIDGHEYYIPCASMGNPPCAVFAPSIDKLDLNALGPKFEYNPLFPERVNVEFIEVVDERTLKVRVWERGSGETMACGTGACAAVVAATLNGKYDKGEDIRVIAGNMVQTVALRAAALGVHLTVTPEAVARLAEAGYDPDYGARPLRRTVQRQLEDPLAEALLTGELSSGGEAEAVVDETGHVAVRAKGALTAS